MFYEKSVQDAVRSVGAQYFIRLNMYPDDQYPTMPKEEGGYGLVSNIDNGAPGLSWYLKKDRINFIESHSD